MQLLVVLVLVYIHLFVVLVKVINAYVSSISCSLYTCVSSISCSLYTVDWHLLYVLSYSFS